MDHAPLPGFVVLIAGTIACFAPSFFLILGLAGLPVVLAWACVYGYVDGVRDRWPGWALGQWLSLFVTYLVAGLVGGDGIMSLALAPFTATVVTVEWMVLVGLAAIQKYAWRTRRPPTPAD